MSFIFDKKLSSAGGMSLILPLDREWKFRRLPADGATGENWEQVDLPHSPFVADLDGREHWFGECEYERAVAIPTGAPTARITLYIGAAMHSAVVWVDGAEIGRHAGGYLPFEVELTASLKDRQSHTVTLRLNNRDNAEVPPGTPYVDLDFCWYGGLYRGAELRCYPDIHITDPVSANDVAGGGLFVRTLIASPASATISVKTHVRNVGESARGMQISVELLQGSTVVAEATPNEDFFLEGGSTKSVEMELTVAQPSLWQPDKPSLYYARVTLSLPGGNILDTRTVRFGIRRIGFSRSGGFTINGRRLHLRGTNRHQEYPYIGYALPAAAQRRDARRIKEAGFDYVRLSHYPQSPDFLDACDELGIVVMNCIPGWQFMGGEGFRQACFQNARDLIRRDRNHPCVVLWELSINETQMDDAFMTGMDAIGHEEYPGDQMFTCGWIDRYDVFTHSRQHGEIHTWQNGDKALVVAEYGDWEFYASTHGFNQKTGAGLFASWSHGRKLRGSGERGLRQQASNHIIALNDTLSSPAVLNGQWSMFDYARGYDAHRAACGIMDIFRLPKFSYYFYRSQRDPHEGGDGWTGGPVVYIASYWTAASNLRVLVFSNCEEVELRHNGALLGRHYPAKMGMTQYLPHPPFVFDLPAFTRGSLEATGLMGSKPAVVSRVASPGTPARLEIEVNDIGIYAKPGEADVLIVYARMVDTNGTLCIDDPSPVVFDVDGEAKVVGPTKIIAEAGIASVVLRLAPSCVSFRVQATVRGPEGYLTASCVWKNPSDEESTHHETETPVSCGVFK